MAIPLTILAGARARERLLDEGLRPEAIGTVVGASGGPKWLVLSGLDRVIFGELLAGRASPLEVIGSSIGAWRHACLAQPDPLRAIDRFLEAYVEQRYPPKPPAALITRRSREILGVLLGEGGAAAVAEHAWLRTHVLTTRCRSLPAIADARMQAAALVASGLLNLGSRRGLGLLLERVVLTTSPGSELLARGLGGAVPTRIAPLRHDNLFEALMATASIPLVLEPVARIPHAPPGPYLDGGVIDYHPTFDFRRGGGVVLYPHFFGALTPGWFDKRLPWRRPSPSWLDDVVLVAPSPAFVASLPRGRIPDRRDFLELGDDERIRGWREVARRSLELGDALADLVGSSRLGELARPFPGLGSSSCPR